MSRICVLRAMKWVCMTRRVPRICGFSEPEMSMLECAVYTTKRAIQWVRMNVVCVEGLGECVTVCVCLHTVGTHECAWCGGP